MHLAIDRVLRITWGGRGGEGGNPIARCLVLFFSVDVAVTQTHAHTYHDDLATRPIKVGSNNVFSD